MSRSRIAIILILSLILLAACGTGGELSPSSSPVGSDSSRLGSTSAEPGPARAVPVVADLQPTTVRVPAEPGTHLALTEDVPLRDAPDPGAPVTTMVPATNPWGQPTTLGVIEFEAIIGAGAEDAPMYAHVQLPDRYGTTGWVPVESGQLAVAAHRITVSLRQRTLTVYDQATGEEILTAPVAIGAPGTPTPTGAGWVVVTMIPPDPGGPYGTFAAGTSLHSEVLDEFGGASEARIAVHGTDRPDLVGGDVSNGCIRVSNAAADRLAEIVRVGDRIEIVE